MKQKTLLTKTLMLLAVLIAGVGTATAADKWVKTAPANLATGDVVVIVDQTSGTAMSNNNGTSSAPSATSVTLSDDKSEISGEVATTLQWEVTVADGSYQFNVADTENYVYCTNTNNGVRVGTNENNAFTITQGGDNNADFLVNTATSRYIGVYNNNNSPQDWRCYTSINANIKATVTAFYKKTSTSDKTAIATIGDLNVTTLDFKAEGTFAPTITLADGIGTGDYTVAWTEVANDYILLTSNGEYVAGTTKGSTSVTVTVTPSEAKATSYEAVSKTFTVKIVNPNANDGSEAKPFTASEAIDEIKGGNTGSYYVSGIISQISSTSVISGGKLTYYISEDGTTANQLQVYKGKNLDDTEFSSVNDIAVGDAVVVYGPFTYYNNKTPELNDGNYLVKHTTKAEPELAFATTSYTVNINADFETPELTNPHSLTVTYASSDEDLALVDESTGAVVIGSTEGTVTITASFAGNDDYKAGSASYTITIEDQREAAPISFAEETIALGADDWESFTGQSLTNEEGLAVTYSCSNSDTGFILFDESDGTVVMGGKEGSAIITATFAGNNTYKPTTASYTITLTLPVDPVVAGTGCFVKVTSTDELTSGNYLIVYGDGKVAFDGSLETLDAVNDVISVDIVESKINSTTITAASIFTIKPGDGTIMSASGQYIGVSSNSNGLKQTEDADTYTNTFSIDESGNAVITAAFDESTMTLRFNSASNQNRFRYYKNGQQAIQLYKYDKTAVFPSASVTVTDAGYATYCSDKGLDFSSVSGLTAYKATITDKKVTFTEVTKVPAGQGMLLKGNEGTYSIPVTASAEAIDNAFVGVTEATEVDAGIFVLMNGDEGVGFYKTTQAFTVGANTAYLPAIAGARSFIGFGDMTTAIEGVVAEQHNGEVYNLQGQRVVKAQKGLYIMDGKKVLVK